MEKPATSEKRLSQLHPVSKLSRGYSESVLTPVTLSGVVAPRTEHRGGGRASDYKLISHSGLGYCIVADDEWREVLSTYCWEEVRVIGLLNVCNMTLIPQKVYPKGPTGENVIDITSWRSKEFVKKLVKRVNDLVLVPAAVYAVMAT